MSERDKIYVLNEENKNINLIEGLLLQLSQNIKLF